MSTTIDKLDRKGITKLSGLVAKLKDADRMEREDAAYELTSNPDPKYAGELCKLLADPDISVRNLVAEVLIKMGKTAAGALIEEASSSDHDVRKFVADIMASIKDISFIPVLIEFLKDPNENVVGSAAEALGHIQSDDAIEQLIECINSHPDSSLQAIEALGNLGSTGALPVLVDLLDSENVVSAYAAVEAIGKMESPQAINSLMKHLQAGNPELRNVVLTTVLKIAGSGSRDDIFNATGGKFVDYLIEATASDDLEVKKAVLNEMAFWTGAEVVSALIKALDYPNEEVIELAQGALRIAGNTGLGEVINGVRNGTDSTKILLIEISSFLKSPELLQVILSQADSENPDIRMAVAGTLTKYSNQEAIEILLKLADDEVGHVRVEALRSLAMVAGESEVEQIGRALGDEFSDVREACLGTLILIAGNKTIRLFEQEIKSPDIQRKIMAVRGLGWIGDEHAAEILFEALNNEEAEVRRYAVIGLSKMKYNGLEDRLDILLSDESAEVRKAVVDAYLNISGLNAGEKIAVLLDDHDMWVRFYAINALASIESKTNLDKLIAIQSDQPPFVQMAIINLIAKHDDTKATAELEKLSQSENEDISNAAREALERR
ncbi:MAG: HEAT repeat domain-containing protein [candidate division Zixibacteria bacterium]|nr:HEAT repeat domain-containing protein [candidate division Zixibacteria bacterium]